MLHEKKECMALELYGLFLLCKQIHICIYSHMSVSKWEKEITVCVIEYFFMVL